MNLKYKLIDSPNPEYNKKNIDFLQKAAAKLAGITDYNTEDEDDGSFLAGESRRLRDMVRRIRLKLKEESAEPKTIKDIHIYSESKWKMYPEVVDDETGLTKYEPVKEFTVDVKLPYARKGDKKISDVVKKAKAEAMAELKEYRENRQKIQVIEKDYTHKSLTGLPSNVKPRYKVAVAGGFSGPAYSYVYKDALRGTEVTIDVPESKRNDVIHLEGGTFLELNKLSQLKKVFEPKVPKTNSHHVGIEIEFISKLDKFDLGKELVKGDVQEFVFLQDDGSVKPEGEYKFAHEICILAPEEMIHLVLQRVLKAINGDKASRVMKRCGLHVHLDMRNRDRKKAFNNLQKAQSILYAMNPRSRLDGTTAEGKKDTVWSRKINTANLDEALSEVMNSGHDRRYYGINTLSWEKHQTFEVRIHSGSTDFTKISNWVKILTSVVNTPVAVETESIKPELFCERYGLDNEILEYIKMRIAKFKDTSGKHITIDEVA